MFIIDELAMYNCPKGMNKVVLYCIVLYCIVLYCNVTDGRKIKRRRTPFRISPNHAVPRSIRLGPAISVARADVQLVVELN